jgi:hypothetical protein
MRPQTLMQPCLSKIRPKFIQNSSWPWAKETLAKLLSLTASRLYAMVASAANGDNTHRFRYLI